MKYQCRRRTLSFLLAVCMLFGLLPIVACHTHVEAEAISGVNSLTCAGFISSPIAQKYIDTMMRYHLNSNTTLQNSLNNGNSIVFMFEGGSDNYWNGSTYQDVLYSTRNQAVVIVVKLNSSGSVYIAYYCENCSSVPDDPDWCTYNVGYSGSTTLMDGVYSFYTWNHTGPYAAFQVNVGQGYYTPSSLPNGQVLGASGINIHTRNLNNCGGKSVNWCRSAGCQLIGAGYDTSNEFNQFMKVVGNITWNSWINYSSGTYNTWATTGTYKGYYVLDRQLGKMDVNGKDYGSGSLIALYNQTALTNITASSTTARNNAGFSLDYKDQCERFASHCTLEVTAANTQVRGAPCSEGTDSASTLIELLQPGEKVTAVGIYKNLYGNYWYEVVSSTGELGYIYSGNVTYIEDHITDITLTGATLPNGHVKGATFYVDGVISAKHNKLTAVSCYIYNGFTEKGDAVTGASDTPTTGSYDLKYSAVDDATWMGALEAGNYTYTISASYINYYATDPTTLQSNSGTLVLMDDYFVVIPSAQSQSTCSHQDTTVVLEESSCTQNGSSVTSCSLCGRITKKITTGGHSFGAWITTREPNCVQEGVQTRTCSACKEVEQRSVASGGHDYETVSHAASCLDYDREEHICSICGDSYFTYPDSLMSAWSENKPVGVAEDLIESKTEYRYSDLETVTNNSASMAGYTQIGKQWQKTGSGSLRYVTSWPSGFLTSHALYSKLNVTLKSATETETAKTTIDSSGELVGYVFYHWCYGTYTEGPINRTTSITNDGIHTTFHAFEIASSEVDPSSLPTASDTSVTFAHASACTDSHWWYYFPIYEQTYTTYQAQYTHQKWSDWSQWSEEAATASDTRRVEQRTLYRYVTGSLGDHSWVDGICQVCDLVCEHQYVNRVCTICGAQEPIRDYYLFGYINGENYACEEDFMNMGQYLFVNGKLVVTFESDSYVGVKRDGNLVWYLTDGYLGNDVKSATLYDANTLVDPDKLFVPGRHEITFTLNEQADGSILLSYEITKCAHNWSDGFCGVCGATCAHEQWYSGVCGNCGMQCTHKYLRNVCTVCGMKKPVKDYYLIGFINGADYGIGDDWQNIGDYLFVNNKLTITVTTDSYVGMKSGDNADWYLANAWHGTDVTATTLYHTNTGAEEKLFVPGGYVVTFVLMDNGNDTYTLSYSTEEIAVTNPTIAIDHPSLSFESEILYNFYFTAGDLTDVVEMGMITFATKQTDGTVANAEKVYPGYTSVGGGMYMVQTEGISAKNLGDAVYMKIYAKLRDGSYVYTNVVGYNAVVYAKSILKNSTNAYMKQLVVAMVNYGTEAQMYFGHNTSNPMNSFLTDAQKALVQEYNTGMVNAVASVDSTKVGSLVYNGSSFAKRAPSVSFDGAFSINYYFTTANVPDGEVKLYYWTLEDYNAATQLSPRNATGSMSMTNISGNQYWGQVSGIAAKELDETVFVLGVYAYNGTTYTTGVLNYHIGKYCTTLAAKDTSEQQDLAKAAAVYGYYAKEYFANI